MTLPALRAASLAAALILLPGAAFAQPERVPGAESAENRLQAAADVFEARMEAFRLASDAVQADARLSPAQKSARLAALWDEQKPHIGAFAAEAASAGREMAAAMTAQIDVAALTAAALADAAPRLRGLIANSAWTRLDADQMVTHGLVAQYGVDRAMDALDEVDMALSVPLAAPVPGAA